MFWKFHLDLAHFFWAKVVQPGDTVVDATAGNGHDAAMLASLAGHLYVFDVQQQALDTTQKRVNSTRVSYHLLCHSQMATIVPPHSAKLIVFNLGYLPGADKSLTTKTKTTLEAIHSALGCLVSGGAISITCYPGHPEGKEETEAVIRFVSTLDPAKYSVSSHQMLSHPSHPHLLFIQSKLAAS